MSYFTSKYYILGLAYATFENHCTLIYTDLRRTNYKIIFYYDLYQKFALYVYGEYAKGRNGELSLKLIISLLINVQHEKTSDPFFYTRNHFTLLSL